MKSVVVILANPSVSHEACNSLFYDPISAFYFVMSNFYSEMESIDNMSRLVTYFLNSV